MAEGGSQLGTTPESSHHRNQHINLHAVVNLRLHWFRLQSLGSGLVMLTRCRADRVVAYSKRNPLVVQDKTLKVELHGKTNRELRLDCIPGDTVYEDLKSIIDPWLEKARPGLAVTKVFLDREELYVTTQKELEEYTRKLQGQMKLLGIEGCVPELRIPKEKDFIQHGVVKLRTIKEAKTMMSHTMSVKVHDTYRQVYLEMDLTILLYITTGLYSEVGDILDATLRHEIQNLEGQGDTVTMTVKPGLPGRNPDDDTSVRITLRPSTSFAYDKCHRALSEFKTEHFHRKKNDHKQHEISPKNS